ncbi:MAG: Uma2 family endonuclease [Acetobacteraceae bacterium]
MNIALRKPRMTREQFFDWAQAQDVRYEFDGFEPVAMTGRTRNHSRLTRVLHRALDTRLSGSGCEPLGPDAGVATIGEAVRYPDALVTCTKTPDTAHVVDGVVVVFEVISPTSGRVDRIVKVREYAAVPSIRRYVILEHTSVGLTVLERSAGDQPWIITTLTAGDTLRMPEIGIEIPIVELYEDTDVPGTDIPGDANDAAAKG